MKLLAHGAVLIPLACSVMGCGGADMTGAAAVSVVSGSVAGVMPVPTPTPAPTPTPTPTPTPAPTPASAGKPVLVAEGDSISVFWPGSYTGQFARLHPEIEVHGTAVGGSTIDGLNDRLQADLAFHPNWVTVLIGANDLPTGQYATPEDWLNALFAYAAKVRASGAKVAVGTVLARCILTSDYDITQANPRHNQRRAVVNAAIRAAVGTKIDAVIDFAADPDMGTDAGACDHNYFKDGLHPTDSSPDLEGGEGRMAQIYIRTMVPLLK